MANIKPYAKKLWIIEGGFVNHPNDKGGATNHGVTIVTYRHFFPNATIDDLKNMSYEQYEMILQKLFWDKWKASEIVNQSIAEMLVDWTYNSGSWGIKIPQRILNVEQDGIVGNGTLNAVNSIDGEAFFRRLKSARTDFYKGIVQKNPSQAVFFKGWINRINSFNYIP